MESSSGLDALLLANLQGGARPAPDGLAEALTRAWEAGRAEWPGLSVTAESFVRRLAGRLKPEDDLARALEALPEADFYLACACADHVPGAVESFEKRYAQTILGALRSVDPSPSFVDEAFQQLRHKLFVTEPAKIATYSGRGPLGSWVRIVALNVARGRPENARQVERDHWEELTDGGDPELEYLRSNFPNELREAFQAALAEFDERDRTLLKLCWVKGLSHAKIASMRNCHQTTVTRQIEALRKTLRAKIQERLKYSSSELRDIVGVLWSRLDLSVPPLLGEETD